jgi:hypothetical protein
VLEAVAEERTVVELPVRLELVELVLVELQMVLLVQAHKQTLALVAVVLIQLEVK